jgi:hypothetical protein
MREDLGMSLADIRQELLVATPKRIRPMPNELRRWRRNRPWRDLMPPQHPMTPPLRLLLGGRPRSIMPASSEASRPRRSLAPPSP